MGKSIIIQDLKSLPRSRSPQGMTNSSLLFTVASTPIQSAILEPDALQKVVYEFKAHVRNAGRHGLADFQKVVGKHVALTHFDKDPRRQKFSQGLITLMVASGFCPNQLELGYVAVSFPELLMAKLDTFAEHNGFKVFPVHSQVIAALYDMQLSLNSVHGGLNEISKRFGLHHVDLGCFHNCSSCTLANHCRAVIAAKLEREEL